MTTERKPRRNAEVIKAWADGADIQFKRGSTWEDYDNSEGLPDFDFGIWRVKPENIVVEECVYVSKTITEHGIKGSLEIANGSPRHKPNIRLEFDPNTYQLVKTEVIG